MLVVELLVIAFLALFLVLLSLLSDTLPVLNAVEGIVLDMLPLEELLMLELFLAITLSLVELVLLLLLLLTLFVSLCGVLSFCFHNFSCHSIVDCASFGSWVLMMFPLDLFLLNWFTLACIPLVWFMLDWFSSNWLSLDYLSLDLFY